MYSSTKRLRYSKVHSFYIIFYYITLSIVILLCLTTTTVHSLPNPFADPAPISLPGADPSLGAGANPLLLDSLVKRLPKKGDKKEILISYLAAVPTLLGEIDQYLLNISASNSAQSSSKDRESISKKLNQIVHCLTTDAYVSVVSGALVAALVEINEDPHILPDYQLKYVFGNTCGNDSHSTRLFMEHWQAGARVFIGPEKNCKTEAAMAASQNLPIISYRCNDQDISRDDYHYRTFARTVPPSGEIFKAFLALLKEHDWRKFSVVYDVKKGHARNELFETLKRVMEEENRFEDKKYEIMNVSKLEFLKMDVSSPMDVQKIQDTVKATMHTTRIYLTFDNVRLFRTMLNTMGELGLTDKGYMLIYVDTNYDWLNVYHAMNNHFLRNTMTYLHHSWDANNSSDRKMLDYSRIALSIIPTPVKLNSQKFYNFWKKAGEYIHYFGVQKTDNLKGNRIACYLYDAVYLYAKAVHELVEEYGGGAGYDPTADGKSIIDRIVNRKYRSIQGFDMRIDSRGNSKGNFSLLSWQKVIPVMNKTDAKYYPLDHALDLTAIFVEGSGKERLPILSFKNSKINWISEDGPPLDEPHCGFQGEKCEQSGYFNLSMGALIFFTLSSTILTVFSVRSRKFEKELSMIWRIEPNEVKRVVGGNESTASLLADTNEASAMNQIPWFNDMKGSGMRGVAYYKGTLVALKEIVYFKKPKELTRKAKKELRVMRQLSHPNLNNFMGIIICPSSICAVREFCSKGSLLDILRNTDLKLDHLYIASFVEDLVKGMVYIHDSELKIHGNLKSTNCLITSRWALQIADYGLEEIREGMAFDQSPAMWENFLWTAPEAMNITGTIITRRPPTQKSDIYSFGVILHEIFTRDGPYQLCVERSGLLGSNNNCSDRSLDDEEFEQIVRKVYNDPLFRPNVENIDAQNYVKEVMVACWNIDPDKRPEFKSGIRNKLKPLFTQIYKRNIMDHMIVMMEKYQTQLEDLVEERTTELRDEQKRSEHLLQRMLPRTVADQLLQGQDVIPEAFPPVTIYFSDIVGFTTIAGDSTPMEIVEFLNKLYTLFDRIIRRYDVYKVETIGDAYMVVSGVPLYKTMEYHAEQIAMMALHILSAVRSFVIPHRVNEQLMIRIGLHTGPCAAGVVGKTMPRYTLFGDTVNTASRMESNGQALKIHCSSSIRNAVSHINEFVLEERGLMPIKGKGEMITYWLKGRRGHEFVDLEMEKDKNVADIFPRQQNKHRGSSWGVNRDSSLSLATDKAAAAFLKRNTLSRNQDSSSCFKTSNREMPSLCEDDGESIFGSKPMLPTAPQIGSRKRSGATRYSTPRNFSSTISNTSSRMNAFELDNMAMRKRSTSLPDGEKLNLDFLNHNTSVSHPSVPTATTISNWKMSPERIVEGSMASAIDSPNQSQYPSYRDLISIPHQRKRGIATVFPIRKRSLSCGDASPHQTNAALSEAYSCAMTSPIQREVEEEDQEMTRPASPEEIEDGQLDDEKLLISGNGELVVFNRNRSLFDKLGDSATSSKNEDGLRSCPQHRRKNKRSFFRDPSPLAARIREASPFGGKRGKSKSRADSLTRMFRRWRGDNEYSDLHDEYDFCEEEGFEMRTRKPMEVKVPVENGRTNRSVSCSPIEGGNSTDNSEPLLALETAGKTASTSTSSNKI